MSKEDTFRNSELEYAKKKLNEYPNHIPQYNCDDSYCTILKHLYQTENFSPELIIKHLNVIFCGHSKVTEPNFKEPQLPASRIICNNGKYTKDQALRLHLLSILFYEAKTIYNMTDTFAPTITLDSPFYFLIPECLRRKNYVFLANQLINSDLTSNNIPASIKSCLKQTATIFREEFDFFKDKMKSYQEELEYFNENINSHQEERKLYHKRIESLQKEMSELYILSSAQSEYNLLQLKKQLDTIKEIIIKYCPTNKKPPCWSSDNDAVIVQDKNIFIPSQTDKKISEFVTIYTYYLIIQNYITMQIPTNDSDNTTYSQYKSYVQSSYAFYLLEICPQYYELKEQARTIRYHFAYKVFCGTKSLLEPYPNINNNKVLFLKPYIDTFLKVDYTRPESTAERKMQGQHSTISEHYNTKILVEKIKVMLYGYFTDDNDKKICIALPQKNNKRYIGSRNLAYVLGIPESKDFFDKILNDKPVNPKAKIPQKISDRWPLSINILSPTYDENNVPYNSSAANNLGFLLNNDELTDLIRCVKILKEKAGNINNIIDEIKAIAKPEKNYITLFDITYFELFYEILCTNKFFSNIPQEPIFYGTGYLWFTLPFIHITNALPAVTKKFIKSPEISEKLCNKFEEIYESLGKSFASGKIEYSVTDIEKIKVDAIVTSTQKTPESELPIAIKANGSKYHKYIIESFNPINENGLIQKDLLELYYIRSLNLAMQNDCHSIAFPSYYFGKKSFESLTLLKNWLHKHYGYYMDITICFQTKKDIETMHAKMNKLFLGKNKLKESIGKSSPPV